MEENTVDKILEKVDIVKVVSNYIQLNKNGRNYVGICPFHDDTKPSLTVSPSKQIFKCFVCNEGGNAITFIMKYEKCGFKEAYNKLIEIGGLSPELKLKVSSELTYNPYDANQRRQIEMNEVIQKFVGYMLTTDIEGCLQYTEKRGFDDVQRKKFGLGYLHDSEKLIMALKKNNFTDEEIIKNDFFRKSKYGIYSPYEHRLTIPIYDQYNYLIGFAGRHIEIKTVLQGKYINPSTTDLFEKNRILFNHYNAKGALRKSEALYVVEGYMDVLAMSANGYENTVAIMGTALTKEQIELLKKNKDKDIVFVLDGDKAGQKAMHMINYQCIKEGLNPMFAVVPNGMDPDDVFRSNPDEMKEILESYIYGYEFDIQYYQSLSNVSFKKKKEQIIYMMKNFINAQYDSLDLSHFINMMSSTYHIDNQTLKDAYDKIKNQNQSNVIIKENEQQLQSSRYSTTRGLRGANVK